MRLCILTLLCGCGSSQESSADVAWDESEIPDVGWLVSTWGSAPDDVYAVGGVEGQGALLHFDGEAWSTVTLPPTTNLLTWVHGFDADDVTVVGHGGTALHFDGAAWRAQTTPTDQDLWGVWGAAPNDLWAVGGNGREDGDATLLHFDGERWSRSDVIELERAGVRAFYKVWGTGRDNVYVVGQRGGVLRFDGKRWRELLVGASDDLVSLWGTGPEDIVVVGGRSTGVVSRFDGETWTTETLVEFPGFNGVWFDDESEVHIAGVGGTLIQLDVETLDVRESMLETDVDLHAVFGFPDGGVFAVGGNFAGPVPPYEGVALVRSDSKP